MEKEHEDSKQPGRVLELVELTHRLTRDIGLELTRHATPAPYRDAKWAAVMIVSRAAECLSSIALLVQNGKERDAAVLLVVLLEMQYDIAFIARDPQRATTWLGHQQEGTKPWRVRNLIDALFPTADEREPVLDLYRRFSMVKHSNPVASTASFPIAFNSTERALTARAASMPMLVTSLIVAGLTSATIAEDGVKCLGLLPDALTGLSATLQRTRDRLNEELDLTVYEGVAEILRDQRRAREKEGSD